MITGVIAAHPDDEVLGCGGTIARLAKKDDVHLLILGEGIAARYGRRGGIVKRQVQRLWADARSAAEFLGVRSIRFFGLADNRFDEISLLAIVRRIEQWLKKWQPQVVYTHHPGDLNIDHQVTFRAVLTATRPLSGCTVKQLYTFEVPSSTEWAFQRFEPVLRPNVFVDISSTIETKLRALKRYTSEVRAFPHPRSPEALRAIARRWGSVVGLGYAEAFELVRLVR